MFKIIVNRVHLLFSFRLLVEQNNQIEDITSGFDKVWWAFVLFLGHVID